MKVNLLEKSDDKIVFEITGSSPAFVNTIRRSIVNKVPVMAAEKIDITANSSALYDEMLAHRVGLIPIKFPAGKYNLRKDCSCKGKGCASCEVKGVVKKRGTTSVCGEDIKFTDENVSAKNPKELITKIIDRQEVNFELTARLGTANEHARWQPALVGYKYAPETDISKYCEKCQKELKTASADDVDNAAGKITNPLAVEKFRATVGACSEDASKLDSDKSKLIVTIESVSGLDPKTIVLEALSVFEKELKEFEAELK